jgi:hypothetical protein
MRRTIRASTHASGSRRRCAVDPDVHQEVDAGGRARRCVSDGNMWRGVIEAKQPLTREERIKTAVEWMADGKVRNWKYMK